MKRTLLLFLLLIGPLAVQAQVLLQGTVTDAATGQRLNAAHVVAEGANRGTITNMEGRYEIVVPSLPETLRVRFIGYEIAYVTVNVGDTRTVDIALEPAVYPLGEIFVATPDFAANIMREVIARKQARRDSLGTVQARGYTRLTLEDTGQIKLLSEKVFDIYRDTERGDREVIRSQRETADFYRRFGMEPAAVVDFYADEIEVQGLRMIGPTHPRALDFYNVTLAQRRALGNRTVYDLYLAPKTGLDATFLGRISVLDSLYVLLEAEVRPARHVEFPEPLAAWDVFYRQQFAPVTADSSFWMPVDLRLEGKAEVEIEGEDYRPIAVRQVSRFTDYRINEALPSAPFLQAQRVTVDSASVFQDDLFLMGRNIVALTPREAEALERLRWAGMTLEQAYGPSGAAAAFAAFRTQRLGTEGPQFVWPTIYGYKPWLRYNRVDGHFFGIGAVLPFSPRFETEAWAAQTTGLKRIRFRGGGTYRFGRGGTASLHYHRDTDTRNTSRLYPIALNSLPTRLGGKDYFDYFWNDGFRTHLSYAFPLIRGGLTYREEKHESVERERENAWPFTHDFRENPPVTEGRFRTVEAFLAIGDPYEPFRVGRSSRVELRAERSLAPGFNFTRYTATFDTRLNTFFRSRLRPNTLDLRAFAGTFSGTLPPQRFGVLDGTLGPLSTFGAFRSLRGRPLEGERYAGIFWEHDFRSIPFEILGLTPLVDRKMGLTVFGGHGRTWIDTDRLATLSFAPNYRDGWTHELGLAFTNIGGSPFRLDLSYRLDEPGFFIGFGLSRLP